jgi:hypothetical protein
MPGSVLLFDKDYLTARYIDKKMSLAYTPCSWYLENGHVIAYEYTQEVI